MPISNFNMPVFKGLDTRCLYFSNMITCVLELDLSFDASMLFLNKEIGNFTKNSGFSISSCILMISVKNSVGIKITFQCKSTFTFHSLYINENSLFNKMIEFIYICSVLALLYTTNT